MLEIPLEWNEVPHLIMEEGGILPEETRPDKRKRDEIDQGQRKRRREDRETRTFSHSILEDTKSRWILFKRLGQRQTRGK